LEWLKPILEQAFNDKYSTVRACPIARIRTRNADIRQLYSGCVRVTGMTDSSPYCLERETSVVWPQVILPCLSFELAGAFSGIGTRQSRSVRNAWSSDLMAVMPGWR
jgi:hypothetical protein